MTEEGGQVFDGFSCTGRDGDHAGETAERDGKKKISIDDRERRKMTDQTDIFIEAVTRWRFRIRPRSLHEVEKMARTLLYATKADKELAHFEKGRGGKR